jgi:hypothetical protein
MIPMTYATSCETALPLSLGFPVCLWPETKRRCRLRLVRRCERASDLELCSQKLRKGALKPLKQLVHVNLCAPWEALSTGGERRSPQSPPRFAPPVELPYPGEAALLSLLQRRARRQDMRAANRAKPARKPTKTDFIEHHHLRLRGEILVDDIKHQSSRHRGVVPAEDLCGREPCKRGRRRSNRMRLSLDFGRSLVRTRGRTGTALGRGKDRRN